MKIKFCGLTRAADVDAAIAVGADYMGLNFFPKSPRYLTPEAAGHLAARAAGHLTAVALVVDPTDALLDEILAAASIDMIQLHGRESPDRVAAVRARTGLPVMKVLGVGAPDDLAAIDTYASVADHLLIDAKPPKNAVLPGGNGVAFDWGLLSGRTWTRPWMLAGGLTADNVAEAVARTKAPAVDLASGIESAPGVKDAGLMAKFAVALSAD